MAGNTTGRQRGQMMAEWIPLLLAVLTALSGGIGWLIRRWIHGRQEDVKTQAEADRAATEVALMPVAAYQQLVKDMREDIGRLREDLESSEARVDRLRSRVATLEGEKGHDREEMIKAQEEIQQLRREVQAGAAALARVTKEHDEDRRQIIALRRGVGLLIEQIEAQGLDPVWRPDNGNSERSDKT